jgi:hypothetical protein
MTTTTSGHDNEPLPGFGGGPDREDPAEYHGLNWPKRTPSQPDNTYALLAREKKARKLADVIAAAQITAAQVEEALNNVVFWQTACEGAGTHRPSPETRKLVVEMLRERERAAR